MSQQKGLASNETFKFENPMLTKGKWKRVEVTDDIYCWVNQTTRAVVTEIPVGAITDDGWKRCEENGEMWWMHISTDELVWDGPWVEREKGLKIAREIARAREQAARDALTGQHDNLNLKQPSGVPHIPPYDAHDTEPSRSLPTDDDLARAENRWKAGRYPRTTAEQTYDYFREMEAAENKRRTLEITAMELAAKQAGSEAASVVANQMKKEKFRLEQAEKSMEKLRLQEAEAEAEAEIEKSMEKLRLEKIEEGGREGIADSEK